MKLPFGLRPVPWGTVTHHTNSLWVKWASSQQPQHWVRDAGHLWFLHRSEWSSLWIRTEDLSVDMMQVLAEIPELVPSKLALRMGKFSCPSAVLCWGY